MSEVYTNSKKRSFLPPKGTGICMGAALLLTLSSSWITQLIFDQLGNQTIWPVVLLGVIVLLGPVGSVFALMKRRYIWSVVSFFFGMFLLQAGYIFVVAIWGP